MCDNPNPFKVGSQPSTASYFSPRQKPQPVAKAELKHQAKPRRDGGFGKVVYQTDRISKQQVLDTFAIYLLNKEMKSSSWPLYVFGDNDIDKARVEGTERDMIGGLAGVLGDYDNTVSFGITSTFYRQKEVNKDFKAFQEIMDRDFAVLSEYIESGHDVVVPSPNMQDLYGQYEHNYWENVGGERKQVIFHNIGTGLARIPFEYIKYIQLKFDALKRMGDSNGKMGGDANPDHEADAVEEKKDAADDGGDEEQGDAAKGDGNDIGHEKETEPKGNEENATKSPDESVSAATEHDANAEDDANLAAH